MTRLLNTRHTTQARIYDFGPIRRRGATLVFDLNSRGGVFSPAVRFVRRGKNGSVCGFGQISSHGFAVPTLKWSTAYRLQRFGGMRAYRAQDSLFRRLFTVSRDKLNY